MTSSGEGGRKRKKTDSKLNSPKQNSTFGLSLVASLTWRKEREPAASHSPRQQQDHDANANVPQHHLLTGGCNGD